LKGFHEFSNARAVAVKPSYNPLAFLINPPYKNHWKMTLLDDYVEFVLPAFMITQRQALTSSLVALLSIAGGLGCNALNFFDFPEEIVFLRFLLLLKSHT